MKTCRLPYVLCFLLLGLSLPARDTGPDQRVVRILSDVRVTEMRFKDAEVEDVLRHLMQASREADPDGIGINLVYVGPKPGQPPPPKVTMDVRGLSLGDSLRLVTEMTGLVCYLERGILRVELRQNQKVETRFYSVDAARFNLFVDQARKR